MVNITDVKQILQFAIDAEIKVFLDGGWGVDALLGYQSRAHNDIDIFVVLVCQTYVTPCLMKSWSVSFGDFHPSGRIGKQL